jgi:type VI secretion system secreted protein VgrG
MRLIEIESPQFDAECVALSFRANERLSWEPSYVLELVSPKSDLDLDALLGDDVSVSIDLGEGDIRHFHAYVFGGEDTGQMDDKFTYRLELNSWLSFLEQNRNCRIFQDLTIPEIVEQVFMGHHRADYRFELQGQYTPREYCVQFRETDLTFVKRLLEDEGLYFYVEHESDRHIIVISDTQRFEDLPGRYATLRFLPDGEEHRAIAGREGVQRLQRTRKVRSNNVMLRDFNYFAPSNTLQVDAQEQQQTLAGVQLEDYDYAAGYKDESRGEWLAQLRLESLQAEAHLLQGQANAMGIAIGGAFVLEGHPDENRNRRFYLVATKLTWVQDGPESTSWGRNFLCEFLSLTDDRPFRPLRLTPKPQVPGTHSATVVGPPGSEIHTDKLARIRVHFHWDRYKTTEEDASCWMRISHAWAGKGWGTLVMPRVGQEVLITYIDGDLDRPLAVGIVYNGENPVPYDLPKDIRYSGIVTRSLKHGEVQNSSQITFDDQRGAERVMIHSERDMQETVERNKSMAVGHYMNLGVADILTIATGHSFIGAAISGGVQVNADPSASDPSASDPSTSDPSTSDPSGVVAARALLVASDPSTTRSASAFTSARNSATDSDPSSSRSSSDPSSSRNGSDPSSSRNSSDPSSSRNGSDPSSGVSSSLSDPGSPLGGMIISLTGVRMSFSGLEAKFTGVCSSFTGVRTSFEGVHTSFKGVHTSFKGVHTSFTGAHTSFKGVSTSFCGVRTHMRGVSTTLTGASTCITGTRTSMTGVSQSMKGVSMHMTGAECRMTGVSYCSTGQRTWETGVAVHRTGTETHMTGTSTSTTGSSTIVIGAAAVAIGGFVGVFGTSTSTTGESCCTTGKSTCSTGCCNSTCGIDMCNIGVKMCCVGIEIKQ